jgi:PAS domain S-box-containing protein
MGRRRANQASEEQLRHELEFRRAIDSSLGEGVYALDLDGCVTYMNPVAEQILGWTEAELRGRIMHDAIHYRRPDGSPFPKEECTGLVEVLRSSIRVHVEDDSFIRKDGTMIPVAYTASPIIAGDAVVGVVVAFQDITERRRSERRLEVQYTVSRILVEAADLDQAAPQILDAIGSCLDWEYGALWSVDRAARTMHCVATWQAADQDLAPFLDLSRQSSFAPGDGLPGTIWMRKEPLWLGDLSDDPVFPRLRAAADVGLRAGFGLPVSIDGHVVGVLEFLSRQPQQLDHDLEAMVRSICGQIAQFVERKRAEADLTESEERYRRLVELMPSALFVHSAEAFVFSNDAGARLLGANRPEDLIGRPVMSVVHPDFQASVRRRTEQILREGIPAPMAEQRLIRLDGQVIDVEVVGVPIIYNGVRAVQTVIRDITRRKQAEAELRNSRDQLDVILAGVADGITAQDSSGRIIYANQAAAQLVGFDSPEEMIAARPAQLMQQFELMDPDGRPISTDHLPGRRALLGIEDPGSSETVVRYRIRVTGQERWALLKARPILDQRKQVRLAINIFRDITEQRRTDEMLRVRARQQAAVAELGRRALSLIDLASLMQETAVLVAQVLGVEYCKILELDSVANTLLLRAGIGWPEALLGQVVAEGSTHSQGGYTLAVDGPVIANDVSTETRFRAAPLVRAAGVVSSISVPIQGWSGQFGVLEVDTTSRRDFGDDDVNFMQSIGNVLTAAIERKAMEGRLARERAEGERLVELDRLRREFIASVSHELRTPLTTMRGGLGMLDTSLAGRLQPDEQQLLVRARRSVEHLRRMIDNLLALNQIEAGTLQLERRPLDLRSVVLDTLGVLYPQVQQKGQQLEIDLPEPLPVLGDARWLGQVVTNLLANAHQHTPAGTRIVVSGDSRAHDVRLVISDSGPGLDGDTGDYSLATIGRLGSEKGGTGLGLAIVGAILERHGGTLSVSSAPGAGARFSIILPRAAEGDQEDA